MNFKKGLASSLFFAAVVAFAPGYAAAENANAELLAGGCVVCHGPGGESHGHITAINTMTADKISAIMREFRDGTRANTIMGKIAKGYSDAQIDLMAKHFGTK